MNGDLLNTIKKILNSLLHNNELDLYFFHSKYAMDLDLLAEAVEYMSIEGQILRDKNKITITNKGKIELLKNKEKYYLQPKTKEWLDIPENFKFNKLKQVYRINKTSINFKHWRQNNISD